MWKVSKPEYHSVRDGKELALSYNTSRGNLWFSVPVSYANYVSPKMDAALIGLLLPAMKLNVSLYLDGSVDELLFYYASGPLQSALVNIFPYLNKIRISANIFSNGSIFGKKIVSGLSRGVDSFSIIERHLVSCNNNLLKIDCICLHDIWGESNSMSVVNPAVVKRFSNLTPILDRLEYPAYLVNSNLGFYYSGINFISTHSIRNVAAAHLMANEVGTYLYASTGLPMSVQSLSKQTDIGRSDLILLPMMSSSELRCISGDSEKTRLEKIMGIADSQIVHEFLNVCSFSVEYNCSQCEKCLRTMFAIEALGKESFFSNIFNFNKYSKLKGNYISENFNDPFVKEVIDFIANNKNVS